jgi:D-alanyl-D-alanine carboxypeptidase/D-alanyl-D-alanine-endopeptidase (penicillin-binding protein 4)
VFSRGADESLNPASNAKLITAAAALALLGADHRYVTTMHGRVAPDGTAVTGPLVLRGGGDPSLSTADLLAMARELRNAGIRRVEGGVLVDDAAFGTEHLPPAFEQQPHENAAFRASVSAASVDDNAMTLYVRPGTRAGATAIVTIDPPGYFQLENSLLTSAGGAPAIRLDLAPGASGCERATVGGTIPLAAHADSFQRRIANPSLATGHAVRAALEVLGVRVAGGVTVGAMPEGLPVVASHRSARLSSLLYELGKSSNNFYAEMTLLAIAAQGASPGAVTFERGASRTVEWLRSVGVPTSGLVVRNGSGLFDANRVSARQLAAVLRAVWREPAIRDEFIAQLAVGGEDGTLHSRLRVPGAERWVRAKTGTLDDVIALSGYVLAPSAERTLVFAFVANGVRGRQADARALADRIVGQMVADQLASGR